MDRLFFHMKLHLETTLIYHDSYIEYVVSSIEEMEWCLAFVQETNVLTLR
jgi:hypothetical protein